MKEERKFYLCDPQKAVGCRKKFCAYKKSSKFACYRTQDPNSALTDLNGNPISTLVWRSGTGLTERAKWNYIRFITSRTFLIALTATNVVLFTMSTLRLVLL